MSKEWDSGMKLLNGGVDAIKWVPHRGKNLYEMPVTLTDNEIPSLQHVLDHAYELPETPPGVRPVVVKKPGAAYLIEYQDYCVICGRGPSPCSPYRSFVDIESAVLNLESPLDSEGCYQELDDGRMVCNHHDQITGHINCWKWCACSDCEGGEKIIGFDQKDCRSGVVPEEG